MLHPAPPTEPDGRIEQQVGDKLVPHPICQHGGIRVNGQPHLPPSLHGQPANNAEPLTVEVEELLELHGRLNGGMHGPGTS